MSNDGKFENLGEAMAFIARHCMFHHGIFTRPLARLYLPFCRVIDLVTGGYRLVTYLSKREFDGAYSKAARSLKID
jgi:hypothetical protein